VLGNDDITQLEGLDVSEKGKEAAISKSAMRVQDDSVLFGDRKDSLSAASPEKICANCDSLQK